MSIILQDLTKRYSGIPVVNRVSLQIEDGQLFVLLGSSGSGKSTVLKMVAGLLQPDEGRIELNGQDVTYWLPQKRNTGFVFQNYSVFRHMSVADNVAFGLRIRKVDSASQQQRVSQLLELVDLTGLGARLPSQLSGGQLQRVALARALAYDPAVLLLDEPFGALDVKIRTQLRQSLKQIQKELGVTTILVTHDQEEAFELADQVGVIERGTLVEVNTPEALYHRPRMEFTARFVGGGNVLAGREEQGQIRLGSISLPLPAGAPRHEAGAPVRILFRPESVRLQDEPFSAQAGIFSLGQAEVRERVFTGALERVRLAVEGLRGARPLTPSPRFGEARASIDCAQLATASGQSIQPGQKYWLGLQDYHVLQPSGLKVLVDVNRDGDEDAIAFGASLVKATAGSATLLAVVDSGQMTETETAHLQEIQRRWFSDYPRVEVKVRQGHPTAESVKEAIEGDYELVLMRSEENLNHATPRACLDHGYPVLLAPHAGTKLERILICTAAGEPGKSDLRFGGRIARRCQAHVTLFHVQSPGKSLVDRQQAQSHLEKGSRGLGLLDVENRIKVVDGQDIPSAVLAEAFSGAYDLVLIGAPPVRLAHQAFWSDMATPIARGLQTPLLIVPMLD